MDKHMTLFTLIFWITFLPYFLYAINRKCKTETILADCVPVIYHGSDNNTLTCEICNHYDGYNLTVCDTKMFKVSVPMVLNAVPERTEHLLIRHDNKWNGYLPLQPVAITLDGIGRLTYLKSFQLMCLNYMYYQLYPMVLNLTELNTLTNLTSLILRIPIIDNQTLNIGDLMRKVPSLEVLDLSYSSIGGKSLLYVLQNINHTNIRYMCFRKHQFVGAIGYVSDFSDILHKLNFTFPNLIELDLSGNTIATLPPGITTMAPNLKIFDISENMLLDNTNIAVIIESLMHPKLVQFSASLQGYEDYMNYMDLKKEGRNNGMLLGKEHTSLHDFFMWQMQFMGNCMNMASSGNISNALNDSLVTCKFVVCILPQFFQMVKCEQQNFLPKLSDSFNPDCMLYMQFLIGKNLETLYFSKIAAQTVGLELKGKLCISRNNSLRAVYADDNEGWMKSSKLEKVVEYMQGFSGIDNLQNISFSNNSLKLMTNFSETFGLVLPNIQYIDISGNEVRFTEFCNVVPNLVSLNLRNTNITSVSPELVSNCRSLTTLFLGHNKLDVNSLNGINLTGTDRLTFIDFKSSDIMILGDKFRRKLNNYSNLTIDLSHNPLTCNCTQVSQEFARWIIQSKTKVLNYPNTSCWGPHGLIFINNINTDNFWDKCQTQNTKVIVESVIITLIITLFFVAMISIYRIRWKLKYWMFRFTQQIWCSKDTVGSKKLWKYDAFISYCAEDRFWVHDTLMKTLENTYGFHLCIHYRDFPVGGCIAETISETMSMSREIIIVVSDVALKSEWCQFELDEALMQIHRRKQHLIVIKLGKLKPHLVSAKLANILDNHTFLEWSDDSRRHKLFWATLVGQLYNDPQGGWCCCCKYGARALGYRDIVDPQIDICDTEEAEQENEKGAALSPNLKILWENAKKALHKAEKAKGYCSKLKQTLKEESLPQWIYGPVPWPIDELLEDDRSMFDDQTYEHATERVNLLITRLKQFYDIQSEEYKANIQRVENATGMTWLSGHAINVLEDDDDDD